MNPLTDLEQKLIDTLKQCARRDFEANGSACPFFVAIRGDGKMKGTSLLGAPFELAQRLVEEIKNLTPCAFVNEVWHSTINNDKAATFAAGDEAILMPPRAALDRKEAVMIQFFHKDRHIFIVAFITRPKEGKPTLGEWQPGYDNTESGTKIKNLDFEPDRPKFFASGDVQ